MEILQLRYFFLSAKNENFSTTAKMFDVPTTAVSSSVRRLEEELGCRTTVIATGGMAQFVTPLCRHSIILEKDLLLKGLNLIYKKNKRF